MPTILTVQFTANIGTTKSITIAQINGNPNFWGFDNNEGSIAPDDTLDAPANQFYFLYYDDANDRWLLALRPTGLAQDYFTSIEIETSTGTVTFEALNANTYLPSTNGNTLWVFNEAVNKWTAADNGVSRQVTIL